MCNRFLYALLLLGFITIWGCSDDNEGIDTPETAGDTANDNQEENTDETATLEALTLIDQSYGDNPMQIYDLYLPAGRSAISTKVILLIHGGGWTEGDKNDMTTFVTQLQQTNPDHAIVNMNYVLAGIGIPAFPNQYLDIDRLLTHLNANSENFAILPQYGFIGVSAGAHLSLMYDYAYDTDDQVKFVVDIVGPTDFTDPFFSDDPNFDIALSLLTDESAFPPDTDYAVANSPTHQVSIQSSPTLLFYGDEDPIVPLTNGQTLDAALNDLEITHLLTVYSGGHGDDWSAADVIDLQEKIENFITTHLPIN